MTAHSNMTRMIAFYERNSPAYAQDSQWATNTASLLAYAKYHDGAEEHAAANPYSNDTEYRTNTKNAFYYHRDKFDLYIGSLEDQITK